MGTLGTDIPTWVHYGTGTVQPGDILAIQMFWQRHSSTGASFCSLVTHYSSYQPIKGELFQNLFEIFCIYTFKKETNCCKHFSQKNGNQLITLKYIIHFHA